MTLVAVWKVKERVYAAADTRIKGALGVLSEHGPKLLPLIVSCKEPGGDGFFTKQSHHTTLGYAYAGATLPALSTHALANTLLQNLVGQAGSPPPAMDSVANSVAGIAKRYIREIGEASGVNAFFSAVIFGWCLSLNRLRAFQLTPSIVGNQVEVTAIEHNLCKANSHIIIGSKPELLRQQIEKMRPSFYPGTAAELEILREIDLPRRALQSLIAQAVDPTIGGLLQTGWATKNGFEPTSHMVPHLPPVPGKTAALTVLGFDMDDFGHIGAYFPSLAGR
jgi:hypothetical protein